MQLIDVLPPSTQDMWQMDVQETLFAGVNMTKFWHVCYGSVDGQRDVFEDKAEVMMPLFAASPCDVIHLEFTNRGFTKLDAFREFRTDKVLGVGVVDAKDAHVEPAEQIVERIRNALEIVPADRLLVAPDCGLSHLSRTTAFAKLRAMGEAREMVRREL